MPLPAWGEGRGEGRPRKMTPRASAPHPNPLPASGERGPRGVHRRAIAPLLLLAVALVCAAASAAFAQKFPSLTGRIVDEANLLSAEDKRALEQDLKALEEKSTDQ